jgi:hypothetical protein
MSKAEFSQSHLLKYSIRFSIIAILIICFLHLYKNFCSIMFQNETFLPKKCAILLSLLLYHFSQTFVFLNLNEVSPKCICDTSSKPNRKKLLINDTERMNLSPLKKYWNQPDNLKDLSLFMTYLTYKCINNH